MTVSNYNNYLNPFSTTTAATSQLPPAYQANYAQQNPYSSQANLGSSANFLNALNALNTPSQGQPTQQVPFDPNAYVSKDEYNKLIEENKALQNKLESELAQRVDIEFFKIEQEMLVLPEGARLAQELDYQKNRFFDALWRTSEPGKIAITKYRDSVQGLYDQYRGEMVKANIAPQPVQKPLNQTPLNTDPVVAEEPVF